MSAHKPGPIMPRADGRDAPVIWIVAIMAFLAGIGVFGAGIAWRLAGEWRDSARPALTARIAAPAGPEALDAAAAAVRNMRGVKSAETLTPERASQLLGAWFGPDGPPKDFPMPRLVEIQPADDAPADLAVLIEQDLRNFGVTAEVRSYERWDEEARAAAGGLETLARGALALLGAVGCLVVYLAVRSAAQGRRHVAETLRSVGARDGYTAGVFGRRYEGLAFFGGVIGALAASAAAFAAARFNLEGAGFKGPSDIGWPELVGLIAIPILAAAAARYAARGAALAALKRKY